MILIAVKLSGSALTMNGFTSDDFLDRLLSASTLDEDMLSDTPSLDQFRKACLLALYEFHQYPGTQSWMRIGTLIRTAYRVGLDRIESLRAIYRDWGAMSDEDLQEWRAVWWCIYRLDSYSNLAMGMPYLINETLINTNLMVDNDHQLSPAIKLPPHASQLWTLLPLIIPHPETFLANIHILTVTAMRHVGQLMRSSFLDIQDQDFTLLEDLEQSLSTLRLALPACWLSTARNVFANESHTSHHARLVTIFHLRMTQLLIAVMKSGKTDVAQRMAAWQQVIGACQDISNVAEQWDGSLCVSVDPAIVFIMFTALLCLEVHRKSPFAAAVGVMAGIDHCVTVLLLSLKQFAQVWTLPRLLACKFFLCLCPVVLMIGCVGVICLCSLPLFSVIREFPTVVSEHTYRKANRLHLVAV